MKCGELIGMGYVEGTAVMNGGLCYRYVIEYTPKQRKKLDGCRTLVKNGPTFVRQEVFDQSEIFVTPDGNKWRVAIHTDPYADQEYSFLKRWTDNGWEFVEGFHPSRDRGYKKPLRNLPPNFFEHLVNEYKLLAIAMTDGKAL